jgi:hypothetical protein
MKTEKTTTMSEVPRANRRRSCVVSPWKRREANDEKKKALSPKAASGKAVAVPRFSGKFVAAIATSSAPRRVKRVWNRIPALIAAENDDDPPKPVRKEKSRMGAMPMYPLPFLYAVGQLISSHL